MSAVPPNLPASILQGGFAQRQVASLRDAERNERTTADRQQARVVDQAGSTVETAEDTTSVHTDAEGGGSQGRAFSDSQEEPTQPESSAPSEPDGDEGRIIDLSAEK